MPRAGVAHLTSSNRVGNACHQSQLFCFLPLADAQLNIPVSVNGHFFVDCEARQNLWARRNDNSRSAWNLCLTKNAVAPAYCELIERRCRETNEILQSNRQQEQVLARYLCVFPPVSANGDSYVANLKKECLSATARRHCASGVLLQQQPVHVAEASQPQCV